MGVDPEDVVLLPVAYELKSPRMGEWTKKGWVDGWKSLGYDRRAFERTTPLISGHRADNIPAMKALLPTLRNRVASDPDYFKQVYNYTFNFAKEEGQRSIGTFAFAFLVSTEV